MIDASFGFVHVSTACLTPGAAVKPLGFAGGSSADTASEASLGSTVFHARIRNAYAIPCCRLPTVWVVVADPLFAMSVQLPPTVAWYWYLLIELSFGFVHVSTAESVPVSVSPVGFAGRAVGVAETASDAGPAAAMFHARTWNVYAVAFVRSLIV